MLTKLSTWQYVFFSVWWEIMLYKSYGLVIFHQTLKSYCCHDDSFVSNQLNFVYGEPLKILVQYNMIKIYLWWIYWRQSSIVGHYKKCLQNDKIKIRLEVNFFSHIDVVTTTIVFHFNTYPLWCSRFWDEGGHWYSCGINITLLSPYSCLVYVRKNLNIHMLHKVNCFYINKIVQKIWWHIKTVYIKYLHLANKRWIGLLFLNKHPTKKKKKRKKERKKDNNKIINKQAIVIVWKRVDIVNMY